MRSQKVLNGLAMMQATEDYICKISVQGDTKSLQTYTNTFVTVTNNLGLRIQSRFEILAHKTSLS